MENSCSIHLLISITLGNLTLQASEKGKCNATLEEGREDKDRGKELDCQSAS